MPLPDLAPSHIDRPAYNVYGVHTMIDKQVQVKRARRYHHGDLKSATLDAARAMLEAGEDTLSLRAVAKAVGISPAAIYRHFDDKHALLAALAADGAERMASAASSAGAHVAGSRAAFDACGRAYVQFAITNPQLFRLICAHVPPGNLFEDTIVDAWPPMRMLREQTEALIPGASFSARKVAALQAWSMAHGLALLILDGLVPADPAMIDSVICSKGLSVLS